MWGLAERERVGIGRYVEVERQREGMGGGGRSGGMKGGGRKTQGERQRDRENEKDSMCTSVLEAFWQVSQNLKLKLKVNMLFARCKPIFCTII